MATAARSASKDRSNDYDSDNLLQQPDPWAAEAQYSLLDAPCPPPMPQRLRQQQMQGRNENGESDPDADENDEADCRMPLGGQDVHDWTMDATMPASPQEMLDASLKMLFRSPEKIVDLKRIIAHLAEADALLHQGETAGGIETGCEKWQPLKLHNPSPMPQVRQKQPAVQQQQQQQHRELAYQSPAYAPPQPNRGLEHLKKENEELKAVNKQWHEFWTSQKSRHEKLNEDRDRQLAELRNQLAQARSAQRAPPPPPPPPPPPQPQDPTESLIADTTEAMRRLERERTRLADELARANQELEGLRQENQVLQAQVALYQEDFNRERADRESAQARLAELREQLGQAHAAPAAAAAAAAAPAAAAQQVAQPSPADRRAFMQQRQMQQQQQLLAATVAGANNRINGSNNGSHSAIYDDPPASGTGGGPRPWKCEACTLENPAAAQHCGVCDNAKPQPAQNPYLP